jgi:hypothetical protein
MSGAAENTGTELGPEPTLTAASASLSFRNIVGRIFEVIYERGICS